MPHRPRLLALTIVTVFATSASATTPSGSLLILALDDTPTQDKNGTPHALRDASLFAIAPPEIRIWKKHDLVQIIVRETSRAESSQELETEKEFDIDGAIRAWPRLTLEDLLNFQMYAGRTTDLPAVRVDFSKEFEGEGDYRRRDNFSARLTAEVIEVLPNGNLIIEARTHIQTDKEESTIRVTGVCRPEDITAANTILSNQLHDLKIEKMNAGELKKANQKGFFSRLLETVFAF